MAAEIGEELVGELGARVELGEAADDVAPELGVGGGGGGGGVEEVVLEGGECAGKVAAEAVPFLLVLGERGQRGVGGGRGSGGGGGGWVRGWREDHLGAVEVLHEDLLDEVLVGARPARPAF